MDRFYAAWTLAALLTATPSLAQPKPAAPAGGEPLPRSRFVGQMDAQFRLMDSDRNGQLSAPEIEQFEQQRALAAAKARNDALFDAEAIADVARELTAPKG